MKFGHQFEDALQSDAYPKHWVDTAVPYAKLKKVLATVRQELIKKGYDPATLRYLLENREAEYRLDAANTGHPQLRARLTVRAQAVDHLPVEATLPPASEAIHQEPSSISTEPSATHDRFERLPQSPGPE